MDPHRPRGLGHPSQKTGRGRELFLFAAEATDIAVFGFDEEFLALGQEDAVVDDAWDVVEFFGELLDGSLGQVHVEDDAAAVAVEDFAREGSADDASEEPGAIRPLPRPGNAGSLS